MNKTALVVKGITMYWTLFLGALTVSGIWPLLMLFIPFLYLTWLHYRNLTSDEIFYSMGITWLMKKFSTNPVIMDLTNEE